MKINTKYHDEMEISKNDIWHFSKGIPGFTDELDFYIYSLGDNGIFSVMQSIQHKEVAFLVTSPFHFFPEYDIEIDEPSVSYLKLEDPKDVQLVVILTLGETLASSTANLQAPVVLNTTNRKGKQVILHDSPYHTKHLMTKKVEMG